LHHHHNWEGSGTLLIQTIPSLVVKLVFVKVNRYVLIFQSVAEINRESQIFPDAPRAYTPPILVLNVVFGKLVQKPSCIPNLKLLASTAAEISKGFHIFLDVPLAQTSSNFGLKCCFVKLVQIPICVPHLNLLASTVAEISKGGNFFDAPLAQTPANFGPKRLFW